mmetsp:Transcript_1013/g.3065  ORF Transcript_1013/g.3065 Transcript_1013/m.3065 type:complete len:304 (-) Transcript_1013:25-936(-)
MCVEWLQGAELPSTQFQCTLPTVQDTETAESRDERAANRAERALAAAAPLARAVLGSACRGGTGGRGRGASVHSALQVARGHSLRSEHVHHTAPAGEAVAVDAAEQALRDHLEELVGAKVRPVHRLAQPVQRLGAVASHHEVVRADLRAKQVHPAEEGTFAVLAPEAGDDRLAKVGPEAVLVQQRGDHVGEGLRAHLALLAQPVHVAPEAELLVERLHVRREAGEADERLVADLEDLLHLAAHRLVADAVALVARDGDAVLARHRDDGGTVVLHDARHLCAAGERRGARCGASSESCLALGAC